MTVRRISVLVLVLGLVAVLAGLHFAKSGRDVQNRELIRQHIADAAALAPFERDLRIGMTREQVEAYLASGRLAYTTSGDGVTLEVKIGEDKGDNLACDRWYVYAAMDFASTGLLSRIHVTRIGHCL